jgi:hypothetical protein
VIGDALELDGGIRESIPLLGVERLDLRLEAGELTLRELAALEQLEPLLVDHLGDVGALELVEPLVIDRHQGRALFDRHRDRDAVLERLDLDLDVFDEIAIPQLLEAIVELGGVVLGAGLEPEVIEQVLLGEGDVALDPDRLDLPAGELPALPEHGRRHEQSRGQQYCGQQERVATEHQARLVTNPV